MEQQSAFLHIRFAFNSTKKLQGIGSTKYFWLSAGLKLMYINPFPQHVHRAGSSLSLKTVMSHEVGRTSQTFKLFSHNLSPEKET